MFDTFVGCFWWGEGGGCSSFPCIRNTIVSAFLLRNPLAETESLEAASNGSSAVYAQPTHCPRARRWVLHPPQLPGVSRGFAPSGNLPGANPGGTRLLPTRPRGLRSMRKSLSQKKTRRKNFLSLFVKLGRNSLGTVLCVLFQINCF